MSKVRGFEVVKDEARKHFVEVTVSSKKVKLHADIQLPTRADTRSAGYDFYLVEDVQLLPSKKTLIWTDVKAYMQEDEMLSLHIRSSLGVKKGIILGNVTGIIDSSYYENESNDGNIGISLLNTSGQAITLKAGDRVAQGIFSKYLITDEDNALSDTREGGIGSSGE